MKHLKLLLVSLLTLAVIPWVNLSPTSAKSVAQNQSTALERGYRTGYSDGYNAGFKDISDRAPRDYQSKDEYQRAERSYNEAWGPIEDYRDGYQQGFEAGYAAGYDRQLFNSTVPVGLTRRGGNAPPVSDNATVPADTTTAQQETTPAQTDTTYTQASNAANTVTIPRESVLLVEMLSSLSTDATQRGDRFQARVVEPREYEGAIVEGRVAHVKRPGKIKGVAELQLAFETIRMPDNRLAHLNADVIEVLQMNNRDDGGTVDSEGGVRGKDSTKDDVSKVGAATGIGAIIGVIAGGGKGAAIGAAIGSAVGTGGVLSQRGKDLRLERGQQMRIRTATDTNFEARGE
jgi:hypothetical protein